jgi:hypothetical protein
MSEQAAIADSPIESRAAAALFGDPKPIPKQVEQPVVEEQTDQVPEDQSATSEAQAETAPEFEEVEYEGEKYQVPPKLKEAIIRQSDYTKKTQEVAEVRKLLDHKSQQFKTVELEREFGKSIEPEMSEIRDLDNQLSLYEKANWREIPADERTLHMLEMQKLEKLRAAKVGEIEQKRQQFNSKFQEQVRGLQEQAKKLLKERIPQWSEATAKETRDWAISNGFTEEEVSSIHDPRHAEVLWKAYQYDLAKQSAKPAIAQAKAAKVGSSNPMPQAVKDKLSFNRALKQSAPGSVEQTKLIEQRVGSLFAKR